MALRIKNENLYKTTGLIFLLTIMYWGTFRWMVNRWLAPASYYSHGFLVPVAVGFMIWRILPDLAKVHPDPSRPGLTMLAAGVLIHIVGAFSGIGLISGLSLPVVLMGLILHFGGRTMFKKLLFPVLYLIFMIPLPLLTIHEMNLKLKLLDTLWACGILNGFGIEVSQEGSLLNLPTGPMIVEDACSGLKSLISLVAFSVFFGYMFETSWIRRCVIFVASVPIALIVNLVRIVMLGLVGSLRGIDAIEGATHYFTGALVIAVAISLLFLLRLGLEGTSRLTAAIRRVRQ